MMLLQRLQLELRDRNIEVRENDVIDAQERAESAEIRRQAAIRAAEEAAESALDFLDLPDWMETAIKVAAVGAAVAATIGTGGLALGLAVAGGALLLASEFVDDVAVEMGMSEQDAQWLALGCQIAGSLMMAGSGLVASSSTVVQASKTASDVAAAAEQISTAVQSASTALSGTRTFGQAMYRHEEAEARADADEERLVSERATQSIEESSQEIRELFQLFTRISRRFRAAMDAAAEARQAAIRSFA